MQTILVASDAPTLRREIEAVISGPDVTVHAVTSGPEVLAFVTEEAPDLVIVDMQMGNMGGMAVCLELRLQESYDALDHIAVLMLLDRRPDVFLARRSGAEGWLVKPLDPLRLRRAVAALLDGGTYADDSYHPVPVLVGAGPQLEAGSRTDELIRHPVSTQRRRSLPDRQSTAPPLAPPLAPRRERRAADAPRVARRTPRPPSRSASSSRRWPTSATWTSARS